MDGERGGFPDAAGDFPKEVLDFFTSGGPRLLVVAGKPRVGKTVFALGLAGCIARPRERFLLLTKVPEREVLEAHPWVRDALERQEGRGLEGSAGTGPPPAPASAGPDGEPPRMKSAGEILDKILGELSAGARMDEVLTEALAEGEQAAGAAAPAGSAPLPRPDMSGLRKLLGEREAPEFERLYRCIDAAGGKGGLAVVDRIDRLAEKYGASPAGLCGALKEDVVGRRGTHLVVVPERTGGELEGLADAVVRLKDVSQGDEFLGQLELCGAASKKVPRCMYALRGGRFLTLRGVDTCG